MAEARALSAPHVPSIVTFLNPLIRRLLSAGLPFGPNVLLTVRGRTSGLPRTFPVAILEHEGRRFVQSPFGEVNWVRNLRVNPDAILAKGTRREGVVALELAPADAGLVLHAALAPYMRSWFGRAFVGRYFHLDRGSRPEDFIDQARQHPMFELRLPPGGLA